MKNSRKKIWVLLLDKILIAGILLLAGVIFESRLRIIESDLAGQRETNLLKLDDTLSYNRESRMELYKTELSKSMQKINHELNIQRDSYVSALTLQRDEMLRKMENSFSRQEGVRQREFNIELENLKGKLNLENYIEEQTFKKRIDFIEKQLTEFYWPILIRLEKNNALYRMLENSFVDSNIDKEVLLPNHLEIVEIVDNNIYLAGADQELNNEITSYLSHVHMYQALRQGGYSGFPENYSNFSYPNNFYSKIVERTNELQNDYDQLVNNSLHLSDKHMEVNYIESNSSSIMETISHTDSIYETKISYKTKAPYVKRLDSEIMLSFKGYVKDGEFLKLEIGPYRKDLPNGNPYFTGKRKSVYLEVGKNFLYSFQSNNYRVHIIRIWREGLRTRVRFKVEIWRDKI